MVTNALKPYANLHTNEQYLKFKIEKFHSCCKDLACTGIEEADMVTEFKEPNKDTIQRFYSKNCSPWTIIEQFDLLMDKKSVEFSFETGLNCTIVRMQLISRDWVNISFAPSGVTLVNSLDYVDKSQLADILNKISKDYKKYSESKAPSLIDYCLDYYDPPLQGSISYEPKWYVVNVTFDYLLKEMMLLFKSIIYEINEIEINNEGKRVQKLIEKNGLAIMEKARKKTMELPQRYSEIVHEKLKEEAEKIGRNSPHFEYD